MSIQEPICPIPHAEGKEVFSEAMTRFAAYYGMNQNDVLLRSRFLRPAAFYYELQKYATRYGKTQANSVAVNDFSRGITFHADGRYIVLVKYEKNESDTAEKIRETTYHELDHALSLYQTNLRYPNRESAFQNPKE